MDEYSRKTQKLAAPFFTDESYHFHNSPIVFSEYPFFSSCSLKLVGIEIEGIQRFSKHY